MTSIQSRSGQGGGDAFGTAPLGLRSEPLRVSATRISEASPAPDIALDRIEAAITSFGERIQARRKLMGLTLDALAARAGMSKSYICEIENGKNKNPTIRTALLLARALGWTLSEAVGVWEHASLLHPEAMKIAAQVDILLRPASADTHPKGGDVQQAPLVSGAVGEAETPNPRTIP